MNKWIRSLATATISLAWMTPFTAAAAEESWPLPHGSYTTGKLMADRLEAVRTENQQHKAVWDLQGWYGGDYHRVMVKTEGENTQNDGAASEIDRAEVLYDYLISTFWSLQAGAGLKGTLSSDGQREHYVAIGAQGLAPYWFEVDNTILINESGGLQWISETEYDWVLSQRSFLQPRMELSINLNDDERFARQAGFNRLRIGIRYRYELHRKIAPYVGVYWDSWLGANRQQARLEKEPTQETAVVAGLRIWF